MAAGTRPHHSGSVISDFVVADLDDGQRRISHFIHLSELRGHASARRLARHRRLFSIPQLKDTVMSRLICVGTVTLAIFGNISFAAGQNAPSRAPGAAHPDLSSKQERMVSQALATSPSQPAPVGVQPQIGSRLPVSMTAQTLPSDVADQVPEAKQLLFVKLPDRVVLIDPDTQVVTEIVMDPTTTGSSSDNSVRPSRCTAGADPQC
jgi:hypothetical protein